MAVWMLIETGIWAPWNRMFAFSPQSGEYVADNKKGEHRAMLTLHHQGWFYGRVSIDRWIRR